MRVREWALAVLFFLAIPPVAPCLFAASSTTAPIMIEAGVQGSLILTVILKKNNSSGSEVGWMQFGDLVDIGTHSLRSSATSTTGTGAIAAFIWIDSSSATPYTVTQTGTALSNGAFSLPAGACTVVPVYVPEDNYGTAPLPPGAYTGTAGTWVTANKLLYYSGPGGLSREVTAYYSITDDPKAGATTGVPLNQHGGLYNATVMISVTQ